MVRQVATAQSNYYQNHQRRRRVVVHYDVEIPKAESDKVPNRRPYNARTSRKRKTVKPAVV
ncbi:hypothetical protein TYRP_008488 [Tyrophagus putrescentiae]|nr:hypothetical protein TYRP_008488 [Tyrophagus putrescentiae]